MSEQKTLCPLCGDEAKIETDISTRNIKIYCQNCTPDWYEIIDIINSSFFKEGHLDDYDKDKLIAEIRKLTIINTKMIKHCLEDKVL